LALPEIHEAAEIAMLGGQAPAVLAGRASSSAGSYVLDALRDAAVLLGRNEIEGFCYGPLNKQALKMAGMSAEDEMRFLFEETGFQGPAGEINIGPDFWTSRVTSHVPISEVAKLLTTEGIVTAAKLLDSTLRQIGLMNPRIAVAALNPHAGDGGKFGTEELRIIAPAVEAARSLGVHASGPHPADTVFMAARKGGYDGIVTMYHDQGQIALKLTGFEEGVTLHGGLPWPVTTPAHGFRLHVLPRSTRRHRAPKTNNREPRGPNRVDLSRMPGRRTEDGRAPRALYARHHS
jgi:4-hydroxythreonine-4-phosphate dehydrogenase